MSLYLYLSICVYLGVRLVFCVLRISACWHFLSFLTALFTSACDQSTFCNDEEIVSLYLICTPRQVSYLSLFCSEATLHPIVSRPETCLSLSFSLVRTRCCVSFSFRFLLPVSFSLRLFLSLYRSLSNTSPESVCWASAPGPANSDE